MDTISNKKLAYYSIFCGSDNNRANIIPPVPSYKYDCYFFTNNKNTFENLSDTNWIPRFIDVETTDDMIESCLLAKKLKAMPETDSDLLQYDYLCFMDSKLTYVNDEIVLGIINTKFVNDICIVMRKHEFLSGSVWNEFDFSMMVDERYRIQYEMYKAYIYLQVESGLSDNVDQTHYQCGFIVRDMKNSKTQEIGKLWYDHIQKCGIQDQISFYFIKQLFPRCIVECW